MNHKSTYGKLALRLISAFILIFALENNAFAQTNIALTANGGKLTHLTYGGATVNYSDTEYNDGYIPVFPAVMDYTYVSSGHDIYFYKTILPSSFTCNKAVFYYNDRPMMTCTVQRWDATTQSYVFVMNYVNQGNYLADSITFAAVTTDTLKFSNVQGVPNVPSLGNPTFREIQIYNLPSCGGTPSVSIVGAAIQTPCFGNFITLQSTNNPSLTYGHNYQWQYAPIGSGTWISIPGAHNAGYGFAAIANQQYRVVDTCLSSGQFAYSNTVQINVSSPAYQSISPYYYQGFDAAWTTACAITPYSADVPGPGWSSTYVIGDSAWRRNDQSGSTPATNTAGWGSVTGGQYTPTNISGGFSARVHTSKLIPNFPANLDLYLNCSTQTGDKQLYFYMLNTLTGTSIPGGDSLRILMSVDTGNTWTQLASYDTAIAWRRKSVSIQSNAAKTIIRFQGIKIGTDASDIGLDSVYVVAPCSGTPVAGHISPVGTITACAGNSYNLTTIGTSAAGGLVYTWQQSTNGGVSFVDVTAGSGFNTLFFTTPPLYDTIFYRLKLKCGATGTEVFSDTITLNIYAPQYASLPYSQNFESPWISACSYNQNLPSVNWANTPGTGNNSWRRNDAGSTAGWTSVGGGQWFPTLPSAYSGNFSARFHSNQTPTSVKGNLDLLVNCSATNGDKQIGFAYINLTGNDSLTVLYSVNGGGNFTPLGSYTTTPLGWSYKTLLMPSNSPNTIIRFQTSSEGGSTDIGLDTVTVIPPCTGTPNPGIITDVSPCSGVNFTLDLTGSSVAASLTYQWQDSIPGVSTQFNDIVGATSLSYTTNIFSNVYYRVKVTCTNSNITAITPLRYIQVANFYYCYCASGAASPSGADIGNFSVQRLPGQSFALNNGSASPFINNPSANGTYTDYRFTIPPIPMYHDSMYKLIVSQINSGAFVANTVSVWIDTNRNGVFDVTEKFMHKLTSSSSNPAGQVRDSFVMLNTAFVGITGMRVVMEQGNNATPLPCASYLNGETEDYLVDIRYHPCDGPANAGTIWQSDTTSCVGYAITLIDTTHEHKLYGISWLWEYSPDGNSWATVSNSQGKDTITHTITGAVFFRLRMICNKGNFSLDTTYSNIASVTINPPYACYCYSIANGGNADTSDIGAFTFYNTVVNVGGPHIKNNEAYRGRTDYTKLPVILLKVDSTYNLLVYHILRGDYHADAKITVFMDFNNDLQYNVTPNYTELVWTGYTSATNFTLADSITIPSYAIPNVKTGMRVILNNNTSPNIPSDEACGTYTSGETEDYVVMFVKPTDVWNVGNISQLLLYPNPTEGRFNISFKAHKAVDVATITVTNITGQKITVQRYDNVGKEFTKELDLSGMARGVYLVELKADNEKIVRKVIVK